jgi:hypothetical protein
VNGKNLGPQTHISHRLVRHAWRRHVSPDDGIRKSNLLKHIDLSEYSIVDMQGDY